LKPNTLRRIAPLYAFTKRVVDEYDKHDGTALDELLDDAHNDGSKSLKVNMYASVPSDARDTDTFANTVDDNDDIDDCCNQLKLGTLPDANHDTDVDGTDAAAAALDAFNCTGGTTYDQSYTRNDTTSADHDDNGHTFAPHMSANTAVTCNVVDDNDRANQYTVPA
jgi:hypothetical protein